MFVISATGAAVIAPVLLLIAKLFTDEIDQSPSSPSASASSWS